MLSWCCGMVESLVIWLLGHYQLVYLTHAESLMLPLLQF